MPLTQEQIAALVAAEQAKGLGYAESAAKVSRDTGIGGGEVMCAVIATRNLNLVELEA